MERQLILASASPRRSELLKRMGLSFQTEPSQVEENATGTGEQIACRLAMLKAEDVAKRNPDAIVLGADTVVCLDNVVLGKPKDKEDARTMLRMLSGKWHEVYTGVAVACGERINAQAVCSRVHFIELDEATIDSYLETDEAMDKAGAYGIQGMAGMFIDRIDGCPHNVMGLPLAVTRAMLHAEGV